MHPQFLRTLFLKARNWRYYIQSSAETYIRFIMNSIGGKTLSPDIIGTATISGAKLFLMKDLKLIYIFQDKLIIKFYFKVTKRNANLPFLSVNFPSVCSEITSQIVCKFLQIIVYPSNFGIIPNFLRCSNDS